jgi:hypothetical protein
VSGTGRSFESPARTQILTKGVDIDDTEFVASAEHIKAKLLSGYKHLAAGLKKEKWDRFITTNELLLLMKQN